jgi:hypothetical protein
MTRFCRKAALAAAAAAVMGAAAPSLAQPAPPAGPPAASDSAAPQPGPGMGPPPWARGGRHELHGPRFGGPMGPRGPLTGLIMPREDKQLTADEAVRIAEGFLLWMGERDWKIANATQQDDRIRFDLTTKDGSRIATFTMDRKTGRVQRVG